MLDHLLWMQENQFSIFNAVKKKKKSINLVSKKLSKGRGKWTNQKLREDMVSRKDTEGNSGSIFHRLWSQGHASKLSCSEIGTEFSHVVCSSLTNEIPQAYTLSP